MDILETAPQGSMVFNYRGMPVDPELRALWRISLIALMLLKLCRGNTANTKKIQTLYSLVTSEKKRQKYMECMGNKQSLSAVSIRFDPLVDRAIDIGIILNIFELGNAKNIQLTTKGQSFAQKIANDKEIFTLEKEFIDNFTKSYFKKDVVTTLITGEQV